MKHEPYRDNDSVLHCEHHRKLHLVCDECMREQASDEVGLQGMLVVCGMGIAALAGLIIYLLVH